MYMMKRLDEAWFIIMLKKEIKWPRRYFSICQKLLIRKVFIFQVKGNFVSRHNEMNPKYNILR